MDSVKNFILEHKIVTICRRIYGSDLENLVSALHDGGINLVEVTFDQADPECLRKTSTAIELLSKKFGSSMRIGAGTVLTKEQVTTAKNAGALYIISPNVDKEIIEFTKSEGLVSMPGTMTPSEMADAHKWGADLVKVFPAGYLGTRYMKDVRGPLSHINFIAAGGVTEDNIKEYIDAGYSGFGISGRLTDAALIKEGKFAEFTQRAKNFVTQL